MVTAIWRLHIIVSAKRAVGMKPRQILFLPQVCSTTCLVGFVFMRVFETTIDPDAFLRTWPLIVDRTISSISLFFAIQAGIFVLSVWTSITTKFKSDSNRLNFLLVRKWLIAVAGLFDLAILVTLLLQVPFPNAGLYIYWGTLLIYIVYFCSVAVTSGRSILQSLETSKGMFGANETVTSFTAGAIRQTNLLMVCAMCPMIAIPINVVAIATNGYATPKPTITFLSILHILEITYVSTMLAAITVSEETKAREARTSFSPFQRFKTGQAPPDATMSPMITNRETGDSGAIEIPSPSKERLVGNQREEERENPRGGQTIVVSTAGSSVDGGGLEVADEIGSRAGSPSTVGDEEPRKPSVVSVSPSEIVVD